MRRYMPHGTREVWGFLLLSAAFSLGAAGGWVFHSPAFFGSAREKAAGTRAGSVEALPPYSTVSFVSERTAPNRDYGYALGAPVHLVYTIEEREPVVLDLAGISPTQVRKQVGAASPQRCVLVKGVGKNPRYVTHALSGGLRRAEVHIVLQCFQPGPSTVTIAPFAIGFRSRATGTSSTTLTPRAVFHTARTIHLPLTAQAMPRPFHEAEAHPRFGFMFGGMLVAVLSLAYAVSRMLRQRRARRVREDGASSPVLASAERLMLRYRADERIEDFVLLLSQEGLIPEGLERAAERILDGSAASDDIVRFLDAALSAMRRNGAAAERTL